MTMIKLDQRTISRAFATSDNQADVLLSLYRVAHPNMDNIKKINGFPRVSSHTAHVIQKAFIDFDSVYHQDVLPGGLWMNMGFSIDRTLPDWVVLPAEVQ